MGTQKLLLPYGERTIIESVIQHVFESGLKNLMLVLGANNEEIKKATAHLGVHYCLNKDHQDGMLSSVICGFRSIPKDATAALVYLGDQPDIPPKVTKAVIKAFNENSKGIVIPVFNNKRGHPLLVDMKYLKDIESLNLEKGLRSLIHLFPDDVLEVEVDEPEILEDIDTREDYTKASRKR